MTWRILGAILGLTLTSGCGSVTTFELDLGLQGPPVIADYFPRIGLEINITQEVPSYELQIPE